MMKTEFTQTVQCVKMLKHSTAGTHNKDIKAEQTNEQTVQKSLWESLRKDMEVLRYRL